MSHQWLHLYYHSTCIIIPTSDNHPIQHILHTHVSAHYVCPLRLLTLGSGLAPALCLGFDLLLLLFLLLFAVSALGLLLALA
jgi:hypothetical protein